MAIVNGVTIDERLGKHLLSLKEIWRTSWQPLVNEFLGILKRNNIYNAYLKHYYLYCSQIPINDYQKKLSIQEIETILQRKFPGARFKKEFCKNF